MVDALPQQDADGQAVGRKGGHLCRREGRAVGQRDAGGKACAHLLRQRGVDGNGVGLGDMALGREDVVGKAAVVRQQDEAGAGLVQPPRREQLPPGVGVPHQIDDGGVPLVGGGADDALGLIEHEVDELLVIERPAVHCHGVGGLQLGVPFLADRTVHGDAPFCQQRLGLAPGALGRLGQIFVESHGVLLILNVLCGYIVAF